MINKSILEEAQQVIADRRARVDGPEGNFERIAKVWSVVFEHEVTTRQVALCMIGLKFARECYSHWRDNLTDLAGYADCLAVIEGEYEDKQDAGPEACDPVQQAAHHCAEEVDLDVKCCTADFFKQWRVALDESGRTSSFWLPFRRPGSKDGRKEYNSGFSSGPVDPEHEKREQRRIEELNAWAKGLKPKEPVPAPGQGRPLGWCEYRGTYEIPRNAEGDARGRQTSFRCSCGADPRHCIWPYCGPLAEQASASPAARLS